MGWISGDLEIMETSWVIHLIWGTGLLWWWKVCIYNCRGHRLTMWLSSSDEWVLAWFAKGPEIQSRSGPVLFSDPCFYTWHYLRLSVSLTLSPDSPNSCTWLTSSTVWVSPLPQHPLMIPTTEGKPHSEPGLAKLLNLTDQFHSVCRRVPRTNTIHKET